MEPRERDGASSRNFSAEKYPCSIKTTPKKNFQTTPPPTPTNSPPLLRLPHTQSYLYLQEYQLTP